LGRPVTIDDAELLAAARDVFLERGASATTEEVAERAGISQASIFKRFKTKQELFLAAMQVHRGREDRLRVMMARAPEIGLRAALIELGVELIGFLEQVFPLVLQGWSNRGEFGFPSSSGKAEPVRAVEALVQFLEAEMAAGRLRRTDPWSVVRAFAGSLQSFVVMNLLRKGGIGPGWNPTDYVTGVVDVLWTGIAPETPPKTPTRRRKQR
jgi:AcrR family transcriptional regulator